MKKNTCFSENKRKYAAVSLAVIIFLILFLSWTIPFIFESSTILYKFGLEKKLLRGGKIIGITIAVLIFVQLVFVARFKFMDKIFGLNKLYIFHGINGLIIAFLALVHPFTIIASEKFTLFPLELRFWPEFLGAGIAVIIVMMVLGAVMRKKLKLPYHIWAILHRAAAVPVVFLFTFHILFVSETFESGIPQISAVILGFIVLILALKIIYRWFKPGSKKFKIFEVTPAGGGSTLLKIRALEKSDETDFIPGQFAFITPLSENIPPETHPFTIAASPLKNDELSFIIKSIGDWTANIKNLKSGEKVLIDGPYGLFSYKFFKENSPLILIAGGIGITPMLSMLLNLADTEPHKKVLLIWSVRKKEDIIFPELFKDLEKKLSNLIIEYIITDEGDDKRTLDLNTTQNLVKNYSLNSEVFICGPPPMMKSVKKNLKDTGFKRKKIHTEKFSL
jgi:predicted ferric reductase